METRSTPGAIKRGPKASPALSTVPAKTAVTTHAATAVTNTNTTTTGYGAMTTTTAAATAPVVTVPLGTATLATAPTRHAGNTFEFFTGNKEKLTESQKNIQKFWPGVLREMKQITNVEPGNQVLPLARIKKIMKLDEDVKMISSDAPLLFAKAIEIFIHELTLRAWLHTEHNKRRTLQRSDIAMAIAKYDQFDFLIDIVPREEIKVYKKEFEVKAADGAGGSGGTGESDVQYYFQLAQTHHQALQQATNGKQMIPLVANGSATPVELSAATIVSQARAQQNVSEQQPSTAATAAVLAPAPTLATASVVPVSVPAAMPTTSSESPIVTNTRKTQSMQASSLQTATGQSIIFSNAGEGASTVSTSSSASGIPAVSASQLVSANHPLQLLQHVLTPSGEITQLPLNFIRTGGGTGANASSNNAQPFFIQATPMGSHPTIIHTTPAGLFLSTNQLQQLHQQQQQQQPHQQQPQQASVPPTQPQQQSSSQQTAPATQQQRD